MKMMQTRFKVDEIKLLIKALDSAPEAALDPHDTIAAAELAAKLRYRAIRLWGPGWDTPAATETAGQLELELEHERAAWQ